MESAFELDSWFDEPVAVVEREPAPQLRDCVRYLAGRSPADELVRMMAKLRDDQWRAEHEYAAWQLIGEHADAVLVPAGYDVDRISPPPLPDRSRELGWYEAAVEALPRPPAVRRIGFAGARYVIEFRNLPRPEYDAIKGGIASGLRWYSLHGTDDDGHAVVRVVTDAAATRALAAFAEKFKFELSDEVRQRFEAVWLQDNIVRMSRAVRPSPGFAPLDPRLWPHQNAGLQYIEATATDDHGVLIADDMGTGKTASALFAALQAGAFAPEGINGRRGMLVICPASVKWKWAREVKLWLEPYVPDLKIRVIEGLGFQSVGGHVVIVNYEVLRVALPDMELPENLTRRELFALMEPNDVTMALLMREWGALITDECHLTKNPEAQRTMAVHRLHHEPIPLKLAMSGSPVLNRTEEFIPQLDMLGLLDYFGSATKFRQLYCGKHGDRKALNERLREIGYLARLKEHRAFDRDSYLVPLDRIPEQTLPRAVRERGDAAEIKARIEPFGYEFVEGAMKLPAKVRNVDVVPFDPKVWPAYERCVREFRKWIVEHYHELFAGDPDEAGRRTAAALRAAALVQLSKLRQLCVRGKLPAAMERIQDILDTGEKLVVFVAHREPGEALLQRFAAYNPIAIRGGQTPKQRDEMVQTFQHDPERRLCIAQIKAGGVGIDLTAASQAVMVELEWNPGTQDQAEDRLHRGGQTRSVTIHYLFAADTVDQDMSETVDEKRGEVTAAIHGGQAEENAMIGRMLQLVLAHDVSSAA